MILTEINIFYPEIKDAEMELVPDVSQDVSSSKSSIKEHIEKLKKKRSSNLKLKGGKCKTMKIR